MVRLITTGRLWRARRVTAAFSSASKCAVPAYRPVRPVPERAVPERAVPERAVT
jgi:hypothetical protein